MGTPHIRAGSGGERGADPVKIENIGGVAGRQTGGPPGQGYSKYQKSLPPRFQRQQQVRILFIYLFFHSISWKVVTEENIPKRATYCYKCYHSFTVMSYIS